MTRKPYRRYVGFLVATCFLGITLYLAHRMGQIERQVRCLFWDLEALAGALRKYWERDQ